MKNLYVITTKKGNGPAKIVYMSGRRAEAIKTFTDVTLAGGSKVWVHMKMLSAESIHGPLRVKPA